MHPPEESATLLLSVPSQTDLVRHCQSVVASLRLLQSFFIRVIIMELWSSATGVVHLCSVTSLIIAFFYTERSHLFASHNLSNGVRFHPAKPNASRQHMYSSMMGENPRTLFSQRFPSQKYNIDDYNTLSCLFSSGDQLARMRMAPPPSPVIVSSGLGLVLKCMFLCDMSYQWRQRCKIIPLLLNNYFLLVKSPLIFCAVWRYVRKT